MIHRASFLLLTVLICFVAEAGRPKPIEVSSRVTRLILPAIFAATAVNRVDSPENREAVVRALHPLIARRAADTDEALAILLGFFLPEDSHLALRCEVLSRGKRLAPLLRKYRNREPELRGHVYSPALIGPYTEYDDVLGQLRAGAKCGGR